MSPVDHDTPANMVHELGTVTVIVWSPVVPFLVIQLTVPRSPSMALDSSPREDVLEIAEKVPLVVV